MHTATFVDSKASEQFVCSICLTVFEKPVQIGCTGHVFCEECIQPLIRRDGTIRCPICRLQCHASTIQRVQFIDRQINNLLVKCPNFEITSKKAEYINKKQSQQIQNIKNNDENTNNHKSDESESESDDVNVSGLRRSARLKAKCSRKKRKRCYDCKEDEQRNRKKHKTNYNELCEWRGCYSDLNDHIMKCEQQLNECQYCSETMLQSEVITHYDICPLFPIMCNQCNQMNIFREEMQSHIENECLMTKIFCPQNCGKKLLRKREKSHIANRCSETMINCIFHKFGCDVKFKRKDTNDHFEDNNYNHLVALASKVHDLETRMSSMQQTTRRQDERYTELQQSNQRLRNQISEQHNHISTLCSKIHELGSIFNTNPRLPHRPNYSHHPHDHYRTHCRR